MIGIIHYAQVIPCVCVCLLYTSYRNDQNEVVGFDVDVAKLIADKDGRELKVEDMNFDSLIGALEAERIDMAIAGMSVTEERKLSVD